MSELDYKKLWKETYDGLDLVMDHFRHVNGFRLPRTISTGATNGRQYCVDRRDRIMDFYKAAMYEDCRINAYPDFEALKQQKHIAQDYKPTPDYLFIDLDRDSFDTDDQLEAALQTTLKNINKYIVSGSSNAAIIQSGNGFHVHVTLKWHTALEQMSEFANFANQDLATRFMRWAERELTEGKANQHHNPSIKSCLFRVPGTINSKAKDAGRDPIVKVINTGSWIFCSHFDMVNPFGNIRSEFVMKFHSHLMQELIDDKVAQLERRRKLSRGLLLQGSNSLDWIDRLLRIGVEDNRKVLLFWVLAPYLITVKGLDYDKAYCILEGWLDKCNEVRSLEPSRKAFRYRLRYCLDVAENQERMPIRFETFKEYYPDVYKILKLGGGGGGA